MVNRGGWFPFLLALPRGIRTPGGRTKIHTTPIHTPHIKMHKVYEQQYNRQRREKEEVEDDA